MIPACGLGQSSRADTAFSPPISVLRYCCATIPCVEFYPRTFLEVARHGNMSRAAEVLSMSQTTVSWRIRHLERNLGVTLFVRTPSGVELTEAGRVFQRHIEGISAATQAAMVATAQAAVVDGATPVATIGGPRSLRCRQPMERRRGSPVRTNVSASAGELSAKSTMNSEKPSRT